jgi:Icc protein
VNTPLRVVQITDCHVPGPEGSLYRDIDPRATLRGVVDAARAWGPDLVLATGDLSEDGSEASYAWLARELGRLDAVVLATPGNHDDADYMVAQFPICAVTAPQVWEADWRIVLLGSAKPGEIPGRLEADQLAALEDALERDGRPTLIALHHQPWPVGSPWIDKYPLVDPAPFTDILERRPEVRLVLWGHVHQDVRQEHGRITGLGAPSTATNSLPGHLRFTADPAGPACRWLELDASGTFRTGLLRPEG